MQAVGWSTIPSSTAFGTAKSLSSAEADRACSFGLSRQHRSQLGQRGVDSAGDDFDRLGQRGGALFRTSPFRAVP